MIADLPPGLETEAAMWILRTIRARGRCLRAALGAADGVDTSAIHRGILRTLLIMLQDTILTDEAADLYLRLLDSTRIIGNVVVPAARDSVSWVFLMRIGTSRGPLMDEMARTFGSRWSQDMRSTFVMSLQRCLTDEGIAVDWLNHSRRRAIARHANQLSRSVAMAALVDEEG